MVKLEETSGNASCVFKTSADSTGVAHTAHKRCDARSDFEVTQERKVHKIDGKLAALS
ncbi:MAG: hypothetical protein GY820_04545 [Gammaproteobacteria bacterium]|nr:hypothetical protein [Gammaproteobacteria bacterium]